MIFIINFIRVFYFLDVVKSCSIWVQYSTNGLRLKLLSLNYLKVYVTHHANCCRSDNNSVHTRFNQHINWLLLQFFPTPKPLSLLADRERYSKKVRPGFHKLPLKIENFVEKRLNRDLLHVDGWLSWSWSKPENVILIEFLRMRTNGVTKGHKTWRYEPGLTSRNITHASNAARPEGNQFPDEKNVNFPVFMSRPSSH